MTWLAAAAQGEAIRRQPFVRWDWIGSHLDLIRERIVEHLVLTGIAVGIGLVVAMLLAFVSFRWRRAYGPLIGVTGAMYAVPSLALFGFFVPITGLSLLTAEIALVSYTLLILLRNIVTGLDGVPASVVEAARGMGYGERRLLLEIQLPLALPVIVAGIRIATVTTIGLVTITAVIGQGGLGALILDGTRRSVPFSTPIVVGTVLSAALAVVFDALLLGVERWLSPWARKRAAT